VEAKERRMSVTDQDLRDLYSALDQGRNRWINGQGEFVADSPVRQADDMTIFGPFGGPGPPPNALSPEELAAGQAAMSARFHGGEGSNELVKTIVEGDLVVVVLIERSAVMFEGHDAPHPWELRTTQIFRRDGERWVRLHRHADPLLVPRSLEATLRLLDRE
jgi:ketosteroid isomerase-like protein